MGDIEKRDYATMRKVLEKVARSDGPVAFAEFDGSEVGKEVAYELKRLKRDGLIESTVELNAFNEYMGGEVKGLTDEGREFYKLVEKGGVWGIILQTLETAGIDVPYPLLKEVCEEVVKRYVTSFIPEIGGLK